MVWPRQKDARGENTKIKCGLDTAGEKEKRTSKKNVDGHDNKKFRTRSMEKQRGIAFGFRKTVTAVKKRDIYIYIYSIKDNLFISYDSKRLAGRIRKCGGFRSCPLAVFWGFLALCLVSLLSYDFYHNICCL